MADRVHCNRDEEMPNNCALHLIGDKLEINGCLSSSNQGAARANTPEVPTRNFTRGPVKDTPTIKLEREFDMRVREFRVRDIDNL